MAMTTMVPWVKRIGLQQIVTDKNGNEYVAIIHDVVKVNGKNKITVKINDHVFGGEDAVSADVWNRGKLTKIIVKLKNMSFIGQQQMIDGWLCTIIKCGKDKFTAVVEGFDGVITRKWDSWKKAKNFVKTGLQRKEIVKIVENVKKACSHIKQFTSKWFMPKTLLLNAPQEVDLIQKLKTTYDLRELKVIYREASKKFHPDMAAGNVEMFKLAHKIYDVRKHAMKLALKWAVAGTEEYIDEVDFNEELTKENEGIEY